LRLQATGVKVKALDTLPEIDVVDEFYLDMYNSCGTDFSAILAYCGLYEQTNEEIIEAVKIMKMVSINASSST